MYELLNFHYFCIVFSFCVVAICILLALVIFNDQFSPLIVIGLCVACRPQRLEFEAMAHYFQQAAKNICYLIDSY